MIAVPLERPRPWRSARSVDLTRFRSWSWCWIWTRKTVGLVRPTPPKADPRGTTQPGDGRRGPGDDRHGPGPGAGPQGRGPGAGSPAPGRDWRRTRAGSWWRTATSRGGKRRRRLRKISARRGCTADRTGGPRVRQGREGSSRILVRSVSPVRRSAAVVRSQVSAVDAVVAAVRSSASAVVAVVAAVRKLSVADVAVAAVANMV